MDFSIAWQKINQMGRDFMALLPNLLFGLVVFVVFIFITSALSSGICWLPSLSPLCGR